MAKAAKKTLAKKTPAKKTAPTRAAAKTSGNDWRGEALALARAIIEEAVPGVHEEAKWKKAGNPAGVPTWSHDGIICTGETYKDKVKLTFARGAALKDPSRLFNSSLEGATRRAIDFHEGDGINEKALKALFKEAAALNSSAKKKA